MQGNIKDTIYSIHGEYNSTRISKDEQILEAGNKAEEIRYFERIVRAGRLHKALLTDKVEGKIQQNIS